MEEIRKLGTGAKSKPLSRPTLFLVPEDYVPQTQAPPQSVPFRAVEICPYLSQLSSSVS